MNGIVWSGLVGMALCILSSCGSHDAPGGHHAPRAFQVNQWDCGDELGRNKRAAVDALRAAQASDAEIALVLAMLMQETNTCSARDRDTGKDGAGDARNFSAYNMNKYCLRLLNVPEDQMEGLNEDQQLGKASVIVLHGLRRLGEDRMLSLHRGGQTALEDGVSYGAPEYRAQMRAVQAALLADRSLWTSNQRTAGHLDHV